MAHIQKIILLVLVVPLALFPGGLISYVLLFEKPTFENSMWIPIGMTALGICSFIFHFKTRKFYKSIKNGVDLQKIDPLFWVLNISFGIAYIIISLYLCYLIYGTPGSGNIWPVVAIISALFVAGIWTVFEAFYLNKCIQEHQFINRHSEIDDIKGESLD